MYKKTITYNDYNDVQRKEDFYFNLSKAELLEMEMSVDGGFESYIKKIINSGTQPELIKIFKDLILRSYGEKSLDGKRFIKNDEIRDAFMQTEAYSELFMELASNDKEAAAFVNGVIPQSLRDQIKPEDLDNARKEMLDGAPTLIEASDSDK